MPAGDHIYVLRTMGYTHHGIDCGDGTVIHFSGEPGIGKASSSIVRDTIGNFSRGSTIHVMRYRHRFDPEETLMRANSRLGESNYHLLSNNCEHFATWCCTGRSASQQVSKVHDSSISDLVIIQIARVALAALDRQASRFAEQPIAIEVRGGHGRI